MVVVVGVSLRSYARVHLQALYLGMRLKRADTNSEWSKTRIADRKWDAWYKALHIEYIDNAGSAIKP
jgi:hypothetical protein